MQTGFLNAIEIPLPQLSPIFSTATPHGPTQLEKDDEKGLNELDCPICDSEGREVDEVAFRINSMIWARPLVVWTWTQEHYEEETVQVLQQYYASKGRWML